MLGCNNRDGGGGSKPIYYWPILYRRFNSTCMPIFVSLAVLCVGEKYMAVGGFTAKTMLPQLLVRLV